MDIRNFHTSGLSDRFQHINNAEIASFDKAEKGDGLMKEFSEILDKIALQLENNRELEFRPETDAPVEPAKTQRSAAKESTGETESEKPELDLHREDTADSSEDRRQPEVVQSPEGNESPSEDQQVLAEEVVEEQEVESEEEVEVELAEEQQTEDLELGSGSDQVVQAVEKSDTDKDEVQLSAAVVTADKAEVENPEQTESVDLNSARSNLFGERQKSSAERESESAEEQVAKVKSGDLPLQEIKQEVKQYFENIAPAAEKQVDEKGEGKKEVDLVEQLFRAALLEQSSSEKLEQQSRVTELVKGAIQTPTIAKQIAENITSRNLGQLTEPKAVDGTQAQNKTGSEASFGKTQSESSKTAGEAKKLPKTFRSRTMEKVEEILKQVASSKDGKTISMRLDPPNLGTLKADITLRDGGLHTRLVAESQQVAQFLRERAFELQAILRRLGIEADTVTVSVSSQQSFLGDETDFSAGQSLEQNGNDSSRQQTGGNGLSSSDQQLTEGKQSGTAGSDDHWVA